MIRSIPLSARTVRQTFAGPRPVQCEKFGTRSGMARSSRDLVGDNH